MQRGKKTVTGVSDAVAGEWGVFALEARVAGSVEWGMEWVVVSDSKSAMLAGEVL